MQGLIGVRQEVFFLAAAVQHCANKKLPRKHRQVDYRQITVGNKRD